MYSNIKNKRIVVTGINGGIAKATTSLLSSLGAEVVVSARNQEKLERNLAELPVNVSGDTMDLTNEASVKEFFTRVGKFDHLVTPAASSMFAPISEMDFEAAKDILASKQWGQMLCVHHALPYLNRESSITLFSGTVTQKPLPGATMFAAVGAATEAAGRIWAYELAPMRVNTVVPGVIKTEVWNTLLGSEQAASAQLDSIAANLPVRHVGAAQDIAKSVAFLIDNDFVNGTSLVVDGGHRLV